ncbi:MAG: hypothetical protein LIO71_07385 [Ruminococcus sp.]|nr:hypothetical protein [Ruminococcus sp.]
MNLKFIEEISEGVVLVTKRRLCNLPKDCFSCKYKDCIAPMNFSKTEEEVRYLNMFLNNKTTKVGRKSKKA